MKINFIHSFILHLFFISQVRSQTADFGSPIDPPLLKKIAAYNAGVVPYSSYLRDIDKFREVNFQSFRIDLSLGKNSTFSSNEPVTGIYNNPTYNFKLLDDVAKRMATKNVLPVYSWCYIPKPFQSGNNFRNLNTSLTDWQTAWKNMHIQFAKHYKDAGIRIGQHEIMNEPDLGTLISDPNAAFLNKDQYNSTVFKDMYSYAATGIKQGDPDAMVGGYAAACGECSGYFIDWVVQTSLPLDFYTYHNYMDGSSYPNELNNVRGNLNKYASLKTCDTYITEFNWTGDGSNTELHQYKGAYRTLNTIKDLVNRTDINLAHWAQFLETGGSDQLGTVRSNGQRLAVFNALKIYGDMPIERKYLSLPASIGGFASSNDHKAAVVLWNTSVTAQTINLVLNNIPFQNGTLRLYRIDSQNASIGDGAHENLEVEGSQVQNVNSGYVWIGSLPAYGVIYITVNDAVSRDFYPEDNLNMIAKDIRIWHYWGDGVATNTGKRGFQNYAEFDRKTWTAYLGTGNVPTAYSITAVEAEQLPSSINVKFKISGTLTKIDINSLLGLRIDYRVGGAFTKSVLFHGGIYNISRNAEILWGTKQQATQVNQVDLSNFNFNPADYAPTGWDGRAIISFILHSTGINTRTVVTLSKTTPESLNELEQNDQADFNIYPNPNGSRNVFVDLSDSYSSSSNAMNIIVHDVQGKVIYERKNYDQRSLEISADNFSHNGMYFITVIQNEQRKTKKMIID